MNNPQRPLTFKMPSLLFYPELYRFVVGKVEGALANQKHRRLLARISIFHVLVSLVKVQEGLSPEGKTMRHVFGVFLAVIGMICLAASSASAGIDASQLVGAWVHTNTADMQGMEFTKQGKVLLYYGGGGDAMTADYSIMDDGRLNLSLGGQVTFYLPTLTGDQLELKSPDTGADAQYRRLKPGETVAAAIAGQAAADQKAIQDRNAALPDFLARKDLVMELINGPPGAVASGVIEFVPNGNQYAGRVCYDSKPPRLESITAQIQGSAENPTTVISFPQNTTLGQVSFHLAGSLPNISLSAQVNFGGTFDNAPNCTLVIKPDADMRKQVLDRFQAEVARLNALKAPLVALLKDYVVLKGTSQSSLPAERDGFMDQFVLARNPQNGTWQGQGQIVNRKTGATDIFPAVAGVGIAGEKAVIQILSQKRVYQFSDIDTTAGKLTGAWQMPNNPNAHVAELTIAQAVDAKGRDQLFTASKAALQKLDSGTVYHTAIDDLNSNGNQPPNPIAVTLTAGANGAITGTADYPMQGCTMNLTGKEVDTPLGPQLQLRYSGGKANPGAWADVAQFINAVQHEAWLLSPSIDSSGVMRLNGYAATNPGPVAIRITLQLIPYTDKDKAAVATALGSGTKFRITTPRMDGVPDDILTFTADPATSKIKGTLSGPGHHINASPGITFSGEIKDHLGWSEIDMPIPRPNSSRPEPIYSYMVVVTPTDNGLYMNGYVYNIQMTAARPLGRWDALEVKP
jgi:hypothetical protein